MEDLIDFLGSSSSSKQEIHIGDHRRGQEEACAGIAVQQSITPGVGPEPHLWFAQLEIRFAVQKITSDTAKFQHCVLALDAASLKSVEDIVLNPPAAGKYDELKKALLSKDAPSTETRMELIEQAELGDRTPSQLYKYIKQLGTGIYAPEVLKAIWLKRLPTQMRLHLVGQDNMDQSVRIADELHRHLQSTQPLLAIEEEKIRKLQEQVEYLKAEVQKNKETQQRSLYRERDIKPPGFKQASQPGSPSIKHPETKHDAARHHAAEGPDQTGQ
ncbi:UNVERIFIED_CONTAM: hypothetical protein PYX00_004223 [Menopon gallinae]|uniref:DUF7041 domain-containing protein n=1 Tax=Menopon gallinae TaxID=328185 RepID=A0AAW2I4R6_9NEOP